MGNSMFMNLEDCDVIITKNLDFNVSQKEEILNSFQNKIKQGIIRSGTDFFDKEWIIKIGGVENTIILPNDIEVKKLSILFDKNKEEFNLAYRSFILLNLNIANTVIKFNLYIRRVSVDLKIANVTNRLTNILNYFFQYIKIPQKTHNMFTEILDNIEFSESNSRILPKFEDILKFTDIVNDIVENKNIIDYKGYMLTIMWWKICSILPLRPSEFLRTEFKCIYKDKDKYYLKVKRSNGKLNINKIKNISKINDYYHDDTVSIEKKQFDFIRNYQDLLRNEFNYKKESELFPVELVKEIRTDVKENRKKNWDIITYDDLVRNIRNFYSKVIEKEHGLKPILKCEEKEKNTEYIEKLTPYDARHVAIINLVLMGTDVLEVMYLAGHTNVNTAYSYFNHVKEFSHGYAVAYAKKVKNKSNIEENSMINKDFETKGNEKFRRILGNIRNEKFEPQKVEGGYCHYRNIELDMSYCYKYERNHRLCEYFVADNKEVIKKEIRKVESYLDSDIKILKDLIKDMEGISKFNELYQTTSYRISKSIQELSNLNEKLLRED